MYEAIFYTPSDFRESDSEQHLAFYQGTLSAYPSMSRLIVLRALLNNELGIRTEQSRGYDDWNLPKELEMEDGREEAESLFRLVIHPVHLERLEVSRVKRFWKMRNNWNDIVIVGAATDGWSVIHWYTTV